MSVETNMDHARKQAQYDVNRDQVVLTEMVCPKCREVSKPNELWNTGKERICPKCGESSDMRSWLMASMNKRFNRVPQDVPRKYSAVTMSRKIKEFNSFIMEQVCSHCNTKGLVAELDDDGNAKIVCYACNQVIFEDLPDTDILHFHGIPVNAILKAMESKQFVSGHTEIPIDEMAKEVVDATQAIEEAVVTELPKEQPAAKHVKATAASAKLTEVQSLIQTVCREVEELLIEKNRKYGNSALEPVRIFSKDDPIEAIKVRIDDKLSRLRNEQNDEDEDVVTDLMGYLVLLKVAQRMKGSKK